MTSQALILKIHCTLSANQTSDSEQREQFVQRKRKNWITEKNNRLKMGNHVKVGDDYK